MLVCIPNEDVGNEGSDLHFVLDSVFVGADSIALTYTSVLDKKVVEVFFFDENGNEGKLPAGF
ncbi:MAG: hypothetical protein NTY39_02295 [Campylobacterales bacterium]|nr:hypothetical protein [Campylobacterales bacterium]